MILDLPDDSSKMFMTLMQSHMTVVQLHMTVVRCI